jgi:hypothetical protein
VYFRHQKFNKSNNIGIFIKLNYANMLKKVQFLFLILIIFMQTFKLFISLIYLNYIY